MKVSLTRFSAALISAYAVVIYGGIIESFFIGMIPNPFASVIAMLLIGMSQPLPTMLMLLWSSIATLFGSQLLLQLFQGMFLIMVILWPATLLFAIALWCVATVRGLFSRDIDQLLGWKIGRPFGVILVSLGNLLLLFIALVYMGRALSGGF